jgi:hypothetical protein
MPGRKAETQNRARTNDHFAFSTEMERNDVDLIRAIDLILGDTTVEPYDPTRPGMDESSRPSPPSATSSGGAEPPSTKNAAIAGFKGGHLRQPSDRQNASKQAWLTAPPPPPPRRPPPLREPPTKPRPSLDPLRVMGPLPPPPIPVEVEPGVIVDVPHYAVHVSRQYKPRLGNRRWHLRFNGNGQLRSCKEKPQHRPE